MELIGHYSKDPLLGVLCSGPLFSESPTRLFGELELPRKALGLGLHFGALGGAVLGV